MRSALALLLLPGAAIAQPAPLELRLVAPPGPFWLGQHIGLTAILRTPIRFGTPPVFPDLPVIGRAILLPNGATTPGSEREGGTSYVLLQHRYDLFPAAAGSLTLAPLRMALAVATPEGGTAPAEAGAPPLVLAIGLPPGTADPARLVTSPSLRLEVGLQGDPSQLAIGAAITRTVTLTAEDSAAMLLPPMPWAAPAGMRVYPDPPELTDRADRGVLTARRRDRAAFVPQAAGRYTLPGASLQWFEPGSGRMQTLAVPPLAITAVAPAGQGGAVPWWPWLAIPPLLLLAGLLTGLRAWHRPRRLARAEADAFAELRRACRQGDAAAAMRGLLRWTSLALPPPGPPAIARLSQLARVPALAEEAASLATRCYAARPPPGPWHGAPLLTAVRRTRRAAAPRRRDGPLPDLNPSPRTQPP